MYVFTPSSTGPETLVGAPVGVTVQFGEKAVPLKFTECTVALRLKMTVSGVPAVMVLKPSHHGIFTVPAPVQLHGPVVLTGV